MKTRTLVAGLALAGLVVATPATIAANGGKDAKTEKVEKAGKGKGVEKPVEVTGKIAYETNKRGKVKQLKLVTADGEYLLKLPPNEKTLAEYPEGQEVTITGMVKESKDGKWLKPLKPKGEKPPKAETGE
ncbi:MAG: hypothetical protein WC789_09680 [Lentisphaeria bacterium]|jgi:hypothetical protein